MILWKNKMINKKIDLNNSLIQEIKLQITYKNYEELSEEGLYKICIPKLDKITHKDMEELLKIPNFNSLNTQKTDYDIIYLNMRD